MTPTPPAAELILRRVGRPYVIEAVRMLEAGEGTVAGIDAALEGVGYARGPLRLLDEIGLDVDLDVDRALHDGDPHSARFDPPALSRSRPRRSWSGWSWPLPTRPIGSSTRASAQRRRSMR